MMKVSVALILVGLACAAANDEQQRTSVTPVQKVIQLLNGMVEKGKKEKHDEQVQFGEYKQFCDDTTGERTRAIAEGNERIEKDNAEIQNFNDQAAQLEK